MAANDNFSPLFARCFNLPANLGHVPWRPRLGDGPRLAASQVKSRHRMSVIRALTGAGGLYGVPGGVNNILKVMTVWITAIIVKERLGF